MTSPPPAYAAEYAVLSAYSVLSGNDISKIMQWEYLSVIFVLNLLNFWVRRQVDFFVR